MEQWVAAHTHIHIEKHIGLPIETYTINEKAAQNIIDNQMLLITQQQCNNFQPNKTTNNNRCSTLCAGICVCVRDFDERQTYKRSIFIFSAKLGMKNKKKKKKKI